MPRTLAAIAVLLLLAGPSGAQTPANPNAPARDARPPQTGTARIRGRVVTDTGQPLRRAPVRLNGTPPRAAITDLDGRYEFASLPAGHFTVVANRVGYVTTTSDAFDLTDGEHRDNINMRVPRGGVITGQVIDEFGDPAIGVTVSPLRSTFQQGRQELTGGGASASTNDIGEYRLFGLMPGQYYLSVTARNELVTMNVPPAPGAPPVNSQVSPETGYAPIYYPGTPTPSGAQRITVAAAQTVSNINIVLTSTRLAKITGIAVDGSGQPLPRGGVQLTRRNGGAIGGGGPTGQIRQDGTFTITNVAPGDYLMRATIVPAGPSAPGTQPGAPQVAVAFISVNGDDLSDVLLAPLHPATVRGRVVFDDRSAAQAIKPAAVRVSVQQVEMGPPLIGGPQQPPPLKDDFTFEVAAAPGATILRANVNLPSAGNQPPWRLKSIFYRGADIVDTGFELKAGEATDEIEIQMTNRQQVVSGQVVDASGKPLNEFSLILFSRDRARWTNVTNRYWAVAVPQPQGGYRMSSLPPGDYYGLAVAERMNVGEWADPDFLEIAARDAASFTLREGDTRTMDFRISPTPTR